MLQIYCPQCGASVDHIQENRMATCPVCRSQVPVPKGYTELESAFIYAMEARLRRDFSAAEKAYDDIVKQDPAVAAAYWGRALSRYAVEYQPLPGGEYRLVCHQAERTDFGEDADVEAALKNSTGGEQMYYLTEIEKISRLQREVARHAAVTEPYQVLIIADGANARAMEKVPMIQRGLHAAGLRSFCPVLELQDLPRQKWEPKLYRAFSTASTMVYVAVGEDAFPADLTFDAERFLNLQAQSQRRASARIQQLIVAYEDLDEYSDIPDAIFDGAEARLFMGDSGFVDELCELASGAQDGFDGGHTGAPVQENFEYANLIAQADQSLKGGHFYDAKNQYEKILSYNPKESQAYWGLMLIEYDVTGEQELIQKGSRIRGNANYKAAVAFATEREQQHYTDVAEQAEAQAKVLKLQAEERKTRQAQLEKERQAANEEVSRKSRMAQQKEEKRSNALTRAAILIVILAVVGGAGGYFVYSKTIGVKKAAYDEAVELYNSGSYMKAAQMFQELEGYDDSEKMYEQCLVSHSEAQYQDALSKKKKGDYAGALEIFESLGDYRDSADQYESLTVQYRQMRFDEAVANSGDLALRSECVMTMKELAAYMPEAQTYLDQWEQEGIDYYNQGRKDEAAYALVGFGVENPWYVKLWREGLKQILQNYASVRVKQEGSSSVRSYTAFIEDGELITDGFESNGNYAFYYDAPSMAVAISEDNGLVAVLRRDGTVYVTGYRALKANSQLRKKLDKEYYSDQKAVLPGESKIPTTGDIAGWTNITHIWIDGNQVIGLKADGTMLSTSQQIVARNVALAQQISTGFVYVDKEGKVSSTVDEISEATKEWSGVQDIYVYYSEILGVYEIKAIDDANQLLYYHSEGKKVNYPTENLLSVHRDAVRTLDGVGYGADGTKDKSSVNAEMISFYILPTVEETTE